LGPKNQFRAKNHCLKNRAPAKRGFRVTSGVRRPIAAGLNSQRAANLPRVQPKRGLGGGKNRAGTLRLPIFPSYRALETRLAPLSDASCGKEKNGLELKAKRLSPGWGLGPYTDSFYGSDGFPVPPRIQFTRSQKDLFFEAIAALVPWLPSVPLEFFSPNLGPRGRANQSPPHKRSPGFPFDRATFPRAMKGFGVFSINNPSSLFRQIGSSKSGIGGVRRTARDSGLSEGNRASHLKDGFGSPAATAASQKPH